jgi:HEAT repeat protein
LQFLNETNSNEIKDYVLDRIISNKITSALPVIKKQLNTNGNSAESIIKAFFFLEDVTAEHTPFLNSLSGEYKKAALVGLLLKKDDAAVLMAKNQLIRLARSKNLKDNKSAVEVVSQVGSGEFNEVLQVLLKNENKDVYCQAIAVTGRVKDFSLFPKLIKATIERQSYYAFDKALVNYGDDVFEEKHLSPESLPDKILHHVIKSAGKIKGEKSDTYLLSLLNSLDKHQEDIVESLWMKKASLEKNTELEKWINISITHLRTKVNCFLSLHQNNQANLLESALFSEIEQNVETILKACAIVYNKEEINRFIEVYKMDDHSKVANAMELLELTIPKKYFNPLSEQIEISHDIKHNQKLLHRRKKLETEGVVKEVITDSHASFNSWSKSVAIYLLPTLYNKDAILTLFKKKRKEDDAIVQETTDYVLTVIK